MKKRLNQLVKQTIQKLNIKEKSIYRKILNKNRIIHPEAEAIRVTDEIIEKGITKLYIGITFILIFILSAAPKVKDNNQNIEIKNNKIEKNNFSKGNKEGYIEAEIASGKYKQKGIYKVSVGEKEPTDVEIVDRLMEIMTPLLILGKEQTLDKVTHKLNLETNNAYNAVIQWKTDSTHVDINTGEVTRPPKGKGNQTCVISVSISKNDIKKNKSFKLTVIEDTKNLNEQNIDEAYRKLDVQMQRINKNKDNSQYVSLPQSIGNSKVNWNEYNPKVKTKDDRLGILILGILLIFYIIYKEYAKLDELIKKRSQEIEIEFCEFLSKFILLMDAGMNIRTALDRIADSNSNQGCLKQELKKLRSEINSGVYEVEAYHNFTKRCNSLYINKFVSHIVQGLKKGQSGLTHSLKEVLDECFENRKRIARKRGEEASTKLIMPMIIVFLAIMLLILYPAVVAIRM